MAHHPKTDLFRQGSGRYVLRMSGTTWVTLLRAVNLGATNKIAMSDLRTLLESLGYDDVRTHLQSGNALFTSPRRGAAALEREIEEALADQVGLKTRVVVRSAKDLDAIVAANPFAGVDPKQLHVVFLAGRPRQVDPGRDDIAFGDRVVYVRLPDGVQGSKLPDWDKLVGAPGTMRTWRTVSRLRELALAT